MKVRSLNDAANSASLANQQVNNLSANRLAAETTADRVAKTTRLRAGDLIRLSRGELLAIWVSRYYRPENAEKLAQQFLNSGEFTGYTAGQNTSEVLKIGDSLFECTTPEKKEKYLATAQPLRERVRKIAKPLQVPLDAAQSEIDAVWPHGSTVLQMDQRDCFVGLIRGFADGGEARPHTDRADWDLPSPETSLLKAQLAWNVYLAKGCGGELELWNYLPSKEEYEAKRFLINGEPDYSLDRRKLPEPSAVLAPEPGDLIVFNAWRVHAVRSNIGQHRVAQSWFTGYFGPDQPLLTFS